MDAFSKALSIVGGPAQMARLLGVTVQAVCFWRDGKRSLPIQHCTAIEQATASAVTRKDLRPDDWAQIWPELIDAA